MIDIIVGTETGTAEFVSDELISYLENLNISSQAHLEPHQQDIALTNTWIICTSTQGAGDVPNNLLPFYTWLIEQKPDLSTTNVILIGLGDKSYDQFCGAAKKLNLALLDCKAKLLAEPLFIDAQEQELPEDIAIDWLKSQQIL